MLNEAYSFILENSNDASNLKVGLQKAQWTKIGLSHHASTTTNSLSKRFKVHHPDSHDINMKDSKGRLIIRGSHRDIKPVKSDNTDIFMPNAKLSYTPMTNFKWNV